MPVSIKGTGGGSVTLTANTASADTTITLPNVTGTILQSGTAVTVAQGGTGLATLTAANNALYSTSSSAMAAGTLPVAAGGTGLTTPGTSGNVLTSNGTAWTSTAPATAGFTSGTAVSASGTSVDFTSIPSTAKMIVVMFNAVSVNGSSRIQVQLGVGGTPETSSYSAMAGFISGTTDNITRFAVISSGFPLSYSTSSTDTMCGSLIFTAMGSNSWTCTGTIFNSTTASTNTVGGVKSLAGALNMVRITTVSGTDTFDAGTINILYQ